MQDSITALIGDDLIERGDWSTWIPDRDVRNLGRSGLTTDALVSDRERIVSVRPASVVLMAGRNDLVARRSVEHVVRNIEFLMVQLRRDLPGTRLLLQSILPATASLAPQVQDANRHLRQFSPTVNAQFLDLWPAIADPEGGFRPGLSDDDLHPNEAGYQVWIGELSPALERLAEAPPMTRPVTIVSNGS